MKRFRFVPLAFCTEALSMVLFAGTAQPVRADQALAVRNGDVNGDGEIDLSDAVYLVSHLFLGGSAPVPCRTALGLPQTGQSSCFARDGTEVSCEDARCPGQDGFYAAGRPAEGRFIDNLDGTVTDTCTGLQWRQGRPDTNDDGLLTEADFLTWCRALSYCEDLVLAGHDDWRLPTLRELQSIVDYGRFNPAIDPIFDAYSTLYWSSTSDASNPSDAWYVAFDTGRLLPEEDLNDDKFVFAAVRAVRIGR